MDQYDALLNIVRSLPKKALKAGGQFVLSTVTLGALALVIGNVDPNSLSPAMAFLFTGLGVEGLGMVLERVTRGEELTREDIRAELEVILNRSNIHDAILNPDFVREVAAICADTFHQTIFRALLSNETELSATLSRELIGADLISNDILHLRTEVATLFSKLDTKRDEQYDDLVRRLDHLTALLQSPLVLSVYPRIRRPLLDIPLIGRDDVLQTLIKKVEQKQDFVLAGQPGSGKSFLFYKLTFEFDAYFVVDTEKSRLVSAINELKPAVLMVDDAFTSRALLEELKQIRLSTGLQFSILANCWLSNLSPVLSTLGLSRELDSVELTDLTRRDVLNILGLSGVKAPAHTLRELIDQAEGRPGLAVTLAHFYKRGAYRDIYSGEVFSTHFFKALIEEDSGKHTLLTLAALALGGIEGMSYQDVAEAFGKNRLDVLSRVEQVSFAGIVFDVSEDRGAVRPGVLREALIKEVFFENNHYQYLLIPLISKSPDLIEATRALVNSKRRGANVPDSLLRELLVVLDQRMSYPNSTYKRVWLSYATLGKDEMRWVVKTQPEYLIWIAPSALNYIPEEIIPQLLSQAVGDNRLLNANPEHPLRILEAWVTDLDNPKLISTREALVKEVSRWYQLAEEPTIALRALLLAVNPSLEAGETDPAEGNSYTIRNGYFTVSGIGHLRRIWKDILLILNDIPIEDWHYLTELAHDWHRYPMPTHAQAIPEEVIESGRQFAVEIIRGVLALAKNHQGVRRSLKSLASLSNMNDEISIDEEFETLYPVLDPEERIESLTQQRINAVQLAARWTDAPVDETLRKLEVIEQQAKQAGVTYPRYREVVAAELAEHVSNQVLWLDKVLSTTLPPDVVYPFFMKLISHPKDVWLPRLHRCLADPQKLHIAISFVFGLADIDEQALELVWSRLGDAPRLVEYMCFEGKLAPSIILRLLNAEPSIASAAAEGLWHRFQQSLIGDNEYYATWRQIVLQYLSEDYLLSEIFKADAAIAFEWVRRKMNEPYSDLYRYQKPFVIALQQMTTAQKEMLIHEVPHEGVYANYLALIVDGDVSLFRVLLDQARLRNSRLSALPDISHGEWISFVILALDAGFTIEEVAKASITGYSDILLSNDERIDYWQTLSEQLALFVGHDDIRIQEIARLAQKLVKQEIHGLLERRKRRSLYGDE